MVCIGSQKRLEIIYFLNDIFLFFWIPTDSEDGMYEELKEIVSKLNNIASDIAGTLKLGGNDSFFLQQEKEKLSILNLQG